MKAFMSPGRLVRLWRADVDVWDCEGVLVPVEVGTAGAVEACRCWRCGRLLTVLTVCFGWLGENGVRPECRGCAARG